MRPQLTALAAAAALLLAGTATAPAAAHAGHPPHRWLVRVTGQVAAATSYSADDLATLPQATLPDLRTRRSDDTVTGTLLSSLVDASAPVLPAGKNTALRVTLTVTGRGHDTVAFALGELAPGNGNHAALLVPAGGRHGRGSGVNLVVPGDRGFSRTVTGVRAVRVAVAAPELPVDVPAGGVEIVDRHRSVVLTADDLAALPTVTTTVAFASGSGPQQHVESGPALARVLRAAHVHTSSRTTVAAVATDGYIATVTPAEATAGRRTLLVSLVEDGVALPRPRLVTDGDVSGGRYVSDVLSLQVEHSRRPRR